MAPQGATAVAIVTGGEVMLSSFLGPVPLWVSCSSNLCKITRNTLISFTGQLSVT